jgi:uncharacterized protein
MATTTVEGHPIERRMVKFDWSDTSAHWVPGDPFTSHVINVLHLLLPAGETWFIEVVNRAKPDVREQELHDAIKPFVQQESWHAQAHARVLEHLAGLGIDSTPYTDRLEAMFRGALGDRPRWPGPLRRWWTRRNLAAVAAIEHFTAVLGHWILENTALDDRGADPEMLDLLRWHGAEEVEHRSLVFDVHRAVGGRWLQRATGMLTAAPLLAYWWVEGVRFLMERDPNVQASPSWRQFLAAGREHKLPTPRDLFGGVPRYLRPSYNPAQEFSTARALDYMARSPAATAARERRAKARSEQAVQPAASAQK